MKFGGGHAGHNGLRSICERVLMDVMYDLPEHEGATAVTEQKIISLLSALFNIKSNKISVITQ